MGGGARGYSAGLAGGQRVCLGGRGVAMLARMRGAIWLTAIWLCASCKGEARRELKVSAAMSLKDVFTELEAGFEERYAVEVVFNFAGSQILAGQILEGAPVDVFAAADEAQMQRAIAGGRVGAPEVFARNALVLVTPADGTISRPEELGRPGLRLVLAGPGVPAGAYARAALRELGVESAALANLVSNEENVRGVLGKVSAGEADVGVVYATDVTPAMADKVRALPLTVSVEPRYEVATLKDSPEASLAAAFVATLQGPEGQMALARRGFLSP